MDPSEFVDEHGRPKESPQRIPVPAILTWLGVGSAIEVLIWGVMTGVWSAALSLAGLVLGAAGAFTLGWDVLLTWANEVRERDVFLASRLARVFGSSWIELGRASEQLTHTAWGLGLLAGGFVLQALGVILTMGGPAR